jgi:superfamily II DNA or RNA helicase
MDKSLWMNVIMYRRLLLNGLSEKAPPITGFSLPEISPDHNLAIQDIFHSLYIDENRNSLIIRDILAAHSEGRECLVLSERLEHLDILYEALHEKVSHLFMLKGGMGKKELQSIMNEIQNVPADENRIILATGKYLGEGFDLPCLGTPTEPANAGEGSPLDILFLVFPFSWKGTLIQYTGRINRAWYGKKEIRV